MLITDERTLLTAACIDPVFVDGVEGLIDYGNNFGAVYFRRRAVRVENGHAIYEHEPMHVIVRPKSSLTAGGPWARWLDHVPTAATMLRLMQ